jgi:hypothetical protein
MFWPTMKRSLGQNPFFVYFRYFWKVRYVTNLKGTFVPVPISTHPTRQPSRSKCVHIPTGTSTGIFTYRNWYYLKKIFFVALIALLIKQLRKSREKSSWFFKCEQNLKVLLYLPVIRNRIEIWIRMELECWIRILIEGCFYKFLEINFKCRIDAYRSVLSGRSPSGPLPSMSAARGIGPSGSSHICYRTSVAEPKPHIFLAGAASKWIHF